MNYDALQQPRPDPGEEGTPDSVACSVCGEQMPPYEPQICESCQG